MKTRTAQDKDDFSYGSSKMAQVLTLGAGGDNQAHVARPKTASQVNKAKQNLHRINSQLDPIKENLPAEEDPIANSQRAS